jgi:hypothetical protein
MPWPKLAFLTTPTSLAVAIMTATGRCIYATIWIGTRPFGPKNVIVIRLVEVDEWEEDTAVFPCSFMQARVKEHV